MNLDTHRLVFNKARGCLMAVAETTRSSSKCASSAGKSQRGRRGRPIGAFFTSHRPTAHIECAQTAIEFVAFQHRSRQLLGSDRLLQALSYDPATVQKRLGDGFYEQKLIREQVAQLTGRRFLGDYRSDDEAYQALMNNSVSVARQWRLRPGIALMPEQIARLTSDIVWLVEQEVVLADGRSTKALVPVVYLSKIHKAELRPTGALVFAQSLAIHATGELVNNGALQAQGSIGLDAHNVSNELGRIEAAQGGVRVTSGTDIVNRSGLISGNAVQLEAARDIQIDTLTRQFESSQSTAAGLVSGSNTEVGPQGRVVSRGDLSIKAERDVLLAGATVSAQGNARIEAASELHIDTLQRRQSTRDVGNSGLRQSQAITNLLSTVQTGGNLALASGADTTLKAARLDVGQSLSITSGANLNISSALDSARLDEDLRAKGYRRIDHTAHESVLGSHLAAGGNVTLTALPTARGINSSDSSDNISRGSITLEGASVNAIGGTLSIAAASDVNIVEARQKNEFSLFSQTQGSKAFSSRSQSARETGAFDTAVGSVLSGKAISITAGTDLTVRGSSIVSDTATTLAAGNNLHIEAARNTGQESQFRQDNKSGLGATGGLSYGSREQSTDQTRQTTTAAASTVGSIGGNVTLTAGQAYRQTGSDVIAPAGDVTVNAKKVDIVEARQTSTNQTEQQFKQSGISVTLSNPVLDAAMGLKGTAATLQAVGNTGNARMQALGTAAAALSASNTAGKVAQVLADPVKAATSVGINFALGSSQSQSRSNTASDTARGSTVAAGGNVTISATGAGQDSNLLIQGSDLTAGNNARLTADNQVKLQAAQNTASQHSTNTGSSASVGFGVNFGSQSGISLNASVSQSRGNADGQDNVQSNTHVTAGNTASLTSGGDTTLKGAVVAARTVKADVGGNLNIESVQDTSDYTSEQSSAGAGVSLCLPPICYGASSVSGSAGKSNIEGDFASVTEQSGLKAGDGGFAVAVKNDTDLQGGAITSTGKAVSEGKNSFTTGGALTTRDIENRADYKADSYSVNASVGFKADDQSSAATPEQVAASKAAPVNSGSAGVGSDKGSASSVTQTAISGMAGNTQARTGDTPTGIQQILDAGKVQRKIDAQVQITQAFGKEASKAVGDYAQKQFDALKVSDPAEAAKWGEGGAYRSLAHAVIGGLTGGMQGAAGAGLAALSADAINKATDNLPDGVRNVVGAAIATGIGAAVGGTTGAATAFNSDMNNRQLHPTEEQWLKTKAKDFAQKEGISEKQALERLTQQAVKNVDYLWRAQLADGDGASAKAFLSDSRQTFTNDLGEQQKLFTTSGQQLFRPEMFADTANPDFYKQFAQSGMTRSLATGLAKELQDSGIDLKNGAVDLAKAVKDNPGAALEGVWKAVKGLPQSVVDGFKETGTAIGEGAAVALNQELTDKLNAIYGSDTAGAQKALLAIRITAALTGATGTAKVATGLTEAAAKAVGKKLDDIAVAKAEAKTLAAQMREIAIHKDDDRFTSVAEKMVDAKQAGWKTADGKTWWPPENGKVPGTEQIVQIQTDQRLDRFGGTGSNSSFLAPANTPLDQRALSHSTNLLIRDEYVVLKPFAVEQSRVMPWFGKEGMGIQFETTQGGKMTIQQLLDGKFIKKASP